MKGRAFGTYNLSEEEVAERSQQMAEALRSLEAKELEKKAAMSRFTAEINAMKDQIYNLRNQVLEGKQTDYFECYIEKDYERQVKRYLYNGQVISTELFDESDKQMHLPEMETV